MKKYYRFWSELPLEVHGIVETDKAIGFEKPNGKWISHMENSYIWVAKSQMIIKKVDENRVDFYIPAWILRKNGIDGYYGFGNLGTYKNSEGIVQI